MSPVNLTRKTQADLRDLVNFYLEYTDKENANRRKAEIVNTLKAIAANPLLGKLDERLGEACFYWYALNFKYKIYYKRKSATSIKVYAFGRPAACL